VSPLVYHLRRQPLPLRCSRYVQRAFKFAQSATLDGASDRELPLLIVVSNKRAADEYTESWDVTTA
jgi:hypothetical protein